MAITGAVYNFTLQANFYFCHFHNSGSSCLRENVRSRWRRDVRRNESWETVETHQNTDSRTKRRYDE
uniref:Uncharacterized protein n=1 Tax=Anguilla anguilla TaxID=7936 RepID=A0A0E9TFV9_ANGAN